MGAIVVYAIAGLFASYMGTGDKWWQRVLIIVLWMPLFAYSALCDFSWWWQSHGYRYPRD